MAAHPLHIGLNCYFLKRDSGGAGTYARELIRGILRVEPESKVTVFATSDIPDDMRHAQWDGDVAFAIQPGSVARGGLPDGAKAVASQWLIEPVVAARKGMDVLHSLAFVGAPLSKVPTVVSILDLIWHHHPGAMSRRNTEIIRVLTKISARRADRLIAISQWAKDDLVSTFGVPAERIDVTLLGSSGAPTTTALSGAQLRDQLGIGARPFVLCAAQKRVHKNHLGLVAAIPHLRSTDVAVVMPGTPTPYEDEVREAARRLGVADRLVLPAWVSDEELEGLYAEAAAFVLPSYMEGFGLPVLEAMERGTPVACSNVSSLPEVAGDAALLFDPSDPRAIAACIDRILADATLRDDLVQRGRDRCRELTWDATAAATLATYRRAIAERRPARR